MTFELVTRKPTGAPPWPLILVEGPEKSGKSWMAAELTASARVGDSYWVDLGEGAADEYGAIPGARYQVVEHDGTWRQLTAAIAAITEKAQAAADEGEPPVVLVVDSMTAEWDMLKDHAATKARRTPSARKKLERDPTADIDVPMLVWNDVSDMHRQLATRLMTFPGIVVITARGKSTAAVDAQGRPIPGQSDYRVEGHKTLAYDATLWVRLSREHPPMVVGARSVHVGVRPGVDKPKPLPDLSLDHLVFDVLKCGPHTKSRDYTTPSAVPRVSLEDIGAQLIAAETSEQIAAVRDTALQQHEAGLLTAEDSAQIKTWVTKAVARISHTPEAVAV